MMFWIFTFVCAGLCGSALLLHIWKDIQKDIKLCDYKEALERMRDERDYYQKLWYARDDQ